MLALLFALAIALAQNAYLGSVIDSDGLPLSGEMVILTSESLPEPQVAVTDERGDFRFEDLPDGAYAATTGSGEWQELQVIGAQPETLQVTGRALDVIISRPPIDVVQLSIMPVDIPCGWAAGVAANATPAGRGWDLSTSGPTAVSMSPVLSRQCNGRRIWAAIDLAPWLKHTYGGGSRASLVLTGSAGYRIRAGAVDLVPYLASQGATWGSGVRLAVPVGPLVLESRVAVFSGSNPDLQGWLLVGQRHRRLSKLTRATKAGVALGTFVGYDRSLYKILGLRAGLLTSPLSDTVLQPTVLGDASVRVFDRWSVVPAMGATWREGRVAALGGARIEHQREARLHAGVLYGPGTGGVFVPDVGVTLGW